MTTRGDSTGGARPDPDPAAAALVSVDLTPRARAPRPGRWRRRVLWSVGGLALVLVLLLALAPAIAQRVAPGIAADSINRAIPGRVSIAGLRLSWTRPTEVGPVELFDEKGQRVASLSVKTGISLGRVLRERLWSARAIDAGEIVLSGRADVVRGADGLTNVERALGLGRPAPASPPQSAPRAAGGAPRIESVHATLRLNVLDLTFVDHGAPPDSAAAAGIVLADLGGPLSIDYRAGANGVAVVQTDLSGAVRAGPGPGAAPPSPGDRQRVLTDATINLDSAGAPSGGKVRLELTNVPTALLDVLAGFQGRLAPSLGPRLDVKIAGSGTLDKAVATASVAAEGAAADLALDYDGRVVSLARPGRLWARSIGFLEAMPAVRERVARVASVAALDQAPGLEIAVESMRLPLPRSLLTAATTGATVVERLDLRQASAKAAIRLDELRGRVSLPQAQGAEGGGEATPPRPFRIDPVSLTLDAPSLERGVDVAASTRASVAGEAAGILAASIHAGGLLDGDGRLRAGIPADLRGEVRLDQAATDLLQPILAGLGLPVNLREDVGPRLGLVVRARTDEAVAPERAAAIPPTLVDASLTSDNVALDAALRLENDTIVSRGQGISARVRQAGPLLRRVLGSGAAPSPVDVDGPVGIEVAVDRLAAPVGGALDPAAVAAQVRLTVKDAVIHLPATDAGPNLPPVTLASAAVSLDLSGTGVGPRAALAAQMSADNSPFAARGELALPDLFRRWPPALGRSTPDLIRAVNAWKPAGQVQVTGLPPSLTATPWLGAAAPAGPGAPDQALAIARRWLGSGVDVVVGVAPVSDAAPDRAAITAGVRLPTASIDAAADIGPSDVALRSATLAATVAPEDANGLLRALADDGSESRAAAAAPGSADHGSTARRPPLSLSAPTTFRVAVDPVRIPLNEAGGLDLARAGDMAATLTTAAPVLIANLPLTGGGVTAGVRGLTVKAAVPGAALAGPASSSAMARASLDAVLIDGAATPLARLQLQGTAPLSAESFDASATLAQVRTAALDALLAGGGDLPGALGEQAEVRLAARYSTRTSAGSADISIDSPRLKSAAPLGITVDADRVVLGRPSAITWTPDVAWLNRVAFPAPPEAASGDAGMSRARIDPSEPVVMTLTPNRIALARPKYADGRPVQGPFKPGVFAIGGVLTLPRLRVLPGASPDGRELPPLLVEGIRASVWIPEDRPRTVAADLVSTVTGDAGGAGGPARSMARVVLSNLADEAGVPTPERLSADAVAEVHAFPTALIDLLTHQGGLLAETMGPVVSVSAWANGLSQSGAGGAMHARLTSARAQATLGGRIENGAFVQGEPVEIRLTQITPSLTRQLAGSIPVVGTLEKTPQDEPAVITADSLRVPIDGDLRKLSGVISVSPGQARFTTTGAFQQLLRLAGQREAGVVGRRLQPFVVHMKDGVLAYDRFRLALGEFEIETRGTVDLVNRRIDVVTYAPFFALTDEAAGHLSTNLAGRLGRVLPGGIDRATLVPIRTRGDLGSPKTEIDLELFFREFGENLLRAPGNIIDQIGRGALEGLLKGKGGGGSR
jgi:hypothetical protein